jgi:hypothetical protein
MFKHQYLAHCGYLTLEHLVQYHQTTSRFRMPSHSSSYHHSVLLLTLLQALPSVVNKVVINRLKSKYDEYNILCMRSEVAHLILMHDGLRISVRLQTSFEKDIAMS